METLTMPTRLEPAVAPPPQPISQQHPIRILIVEDDKDLQDSYSIYIDNVIKELQELNREIPYRIVPADCAAKAKKELQKASEGQAFDLMILDIEIPKNERPGNRSDRPRSDSPHKDNGIAVGLYALEKDSVRKRAFISGKFGKISFADMMPLNPSEEEYKQKGSGQGLSDEQFVRARLIYAINHRLWLTKEEMLPGTITPVQEERWDEKCAEPLAKRIEELVPYAERSVVYSFGLCFSKCLRDVERSGDTIRNEALGRLDLEFEEDTEDFLVQQLLEMDHSLEEAAEDWSKLQTSLRLDFLAEPKGVAIGKIVDNLEKKFEPFKKGKGAQLHASNVDRVNDAMVTSFNDEVEAVLSEMIFGAWADSPDSRKQVVLNLSGEVDEVEEEWVKIQLKDNLRGTLSSEDVRAINAGVGVYSGKRFSRAWGLFVMQHVALHGGGRLTVQWSDGGNTIMYRIPRALNA